MLVNNRIKEVKTRKNINKEVEAVTALTEKKKKEDRELEYDKDLVAIDGYMNLIKTFLDSYHSSRRKVSKEVKQNLVYETMKVVPIFSKYIVIDFYYSSDDEVLSKIKEKELVAMLESAFNDFTHDNLESFNNMITVILKLRDI